MEAKDYRRQAWNDLKGNWSSLVLITLVYVLIIGLASFLLSIMPIGGFLVEAVIYGPLTLGYTICVNRFYHGYKSDVSQLFNGFHYFKGSFLLALISSIFIGLWSLLLFVPGIIKSLEYSLGYFVLADNPGLDGNDARVTSMKIMKGHRWELFCLEFSFIGWFLLSILTFGILFLWVIPYFELSICNFYKEISGQSIKKLNEPVEQTIVE